jgi:hypothetical protein
MELEKLFKEWTSEDFEDWFFLNLQRQNDLKTLYPFLIFTNKVGLNDTSSLEVWREKANGKMELIYKREKQWKSN